MSDKSKKHLRKGQQNNIQREPRSEVRTVRQSYSGPLPPSVELERYENIHPGAAERIITMAEESQKHMHKMDESALKEYAGEIRRGQIYAFACTLSAFIFSALLAYLGHPNVAGIIAGGTIVSIATTFIMGRKDDEK